METNGVNDLRCDEHSIYLKSIITLEDGDAYICVADLFGPSQNDMIGRVLCLQRGRNLVFRAIGAIGIPEAHLLN